MAYIIACSAEDLPYMTTKSQGQYLQWLHNYLTVSIIIYTNNITTTTTTTATTTTNMTTTTTNNNNIVIMKRCLKPLNSKQA